jgi:hypothetical protein
MEEATTCIRNLRRLAAGEVVRVPAFIGLQGLKLEAQDEHEMAFGRLRPPTEDESRYAPFSEISPRVDSVLVADIEIHPSDGEEEQATHLRTAQESLTALARAVCLACALARRDEEGPQSSPTITWIAEVPPFGGSGSYRPGPLAEGWAPLRSYGSDQLLVLADWMDKITAGDLSRVGIAVDRLLRACAEREWGEALIDAVVAWENLLGTRNETTYRVTAALTVLCEDDLDLRSQRQKEFERIYEARSRLIHGDTNEAEPQMRDRAIQVGLEALARLIVDHTALLGLAKSRKRSDQLLLGIAGISE